MLVKLTSKNQLTLPEEVLAGFEGVKYFEVTKDKGEIMLTPVMSPADKDTSGIVGTRYNRSRHGESGGMGSANYY